MNRIDPKVHALALTIAFITLSVAVTASAQQSTPTAPATQAVSGSGGSICVLAYDDANSNSTRDPGETLLNSVGVSVMINNNVIVANHVTDGTEPYCFRNLPPQQYTVSFSSPLAQATTLTSFTFPLAAGEQITKEYGAILALATQPAPASGAIVITTPIRLGLSAAGAVVVMVLVAAVGMIFYGLFWRRLRR
jgi:hypothetical protein